MTAISALASGARTKAGTLSGNFWIAMPLIDSWPVAPQAQHHEPATRLDHLNGNPILAAKTGSRMIAEQARERLHLAENFRRPDSFSVALFGCRSISLGPLPDQAENDEL
jgi:hypothetical protein